MSRDQIFISYSHEDAETWFNRVRKYLTAVEDKIPVWSDQDIEPGELWEKRISEAIDATCIAVAIVTQDFLISDYIKSKEMARFFDAAQRGEVQIIWIAAGWSTYATSELNDYQCVNDPAKPLESLPPDEQNRTLVEITSKILDAVKAGD